MPFDKNQTKHPNKKQTIEGSLGEVFAVMQPYNGCQPGKLVTQMNPMTGIDPAQHDQVAAIFPVKEMADTFAEGLYTEYCMKKEALEEKKNKVTDALKRTLGELEKRRHTVMETIKENPMSAKESRHTIAELTEKIDDLMTKLERIEASKERLEEKNKDKKDKDLKESNKSSDYKIGEEIMGTTKKYFLYNQETGKKEGTYKTKEEAQAALDKKNKK